MKRTYEHTALYFLLICILVCIFIGCGGPTIQEVGEFQDTNLEVAIRDFLGKSEGDLITADDLAGITELNLGDKDIKHLSGLEHCINLAVLYLGGNPISDISPLASLYSLTELDIGRCDIKNISPIASLTNLTVLHLYDNNISNIYPLASLINLTKLYAGGNNIRDISPLMFLSKLDTIYVGSNKISDISPLVENPGISDGASVWLINNNLDLSDGSEDIQDIEALEERGVNVSY